MISTNSQWGLNKKTNVLKTKTKRGMSAERVQDPTETNYMVTSCARNVEDVQGASFMKR